MADNTIAFSVKIDGMDREIKSLSDLKKAKQDATAAFLKGDKDAAKALADLKDKTEDLADATQTLKGSGVEKINASFSQLSEGFKNFDTDKIKTGFKGIGAAMSAIPIFLLIEGLKYLIENFDEVSQSVKKFFNIASDAEKNIKALEKATSELKKTNEGLVSSLENEIKILEAQGNSQEKVLALRKRIIAEKIKEAELDIQLQKAKIAEILSNDSLIESYYRVAAASARSLGKEKEAAILEAVLAKEKNERIKESSDLLKADLITIQNLKTDAQVADIKREKSKNEKLLAEQKSYNLKKKAEDDIYKKEAEDWFQRELQFIRDEQAAKDAARFAEEQAQLDAEARQAAQDEAMEQGTAERNRKAREAKDEERKKEREKEEEQQQWTFDKAVNGAQALNGALQSLSDSYFYFKRKNLEKGSAEDLKQAKKQFDINKGLAIASATISGIQGVVNALSAQSIIPEPYGTVLKVVTAAAVGAAAVANIAKIASSKFDAGGGGGAGGGASAAAPMPIPAPPTINTPTANTNAGSTFDETGKRIGGESERTMNPTITVKANIGVDEVSNKQNRVDTLEKQSTF